MIRNTNKSSRIIVAIVLIVVLAFSSFAMTNANTTSEKNTIILYTNDVHCAIDGYDELAAYRAQLIQEGHNVVTIDAGDAIQGEVIGMLTEGKAIVDLMNTVGYDYAVPGNHEFDYSTDNFLDLANKEAKYKFLSANFIDLKKESPVFNTYDIVDINGEKIAFVGITTPETYTKTTPTYFQDESGNYIYSFSEKNLYETVQLSVDQARKEGATRVIAVGHLGVEGTTEGWKSTDVIANTTGIDAFIDAHSHETIASQKCLNKNNEEVTLSSTGTKFANIGKMTIGNNEENTELIETTSIKVDELSTEAKTAYNTVKTKIDKYNADIEYLYEKLGTSEVNLTLNNPDTDEWIIRKAETNMGDFVADAYKYCSGADIAFANGGGIRAAIPAGDVTRKALMDVNPWGNEMCMIVASGQQILDALEHAVKLYPEVSGGFLQVSGITYDVHAWKESPVLTDDKENFTGIDAAKERRIANVKVGGKALEAKKAYTLIASKYILQSGGDGFTMFKGAEVVSEFNGKVDSDMLVQYFTEGLKGVVPADKYSKALGDGRITIFDQRPTVVKKVKIKFVKTKVVLKKGKKTNLKISLKNAKKAKFSINKKGKKVVKFVKKKAKSVIVKGKKKGRAIITAKAGKKKAACKIKVI